MMRIISVFLLFFLASASIANARVASIGAYDGKTIEEIDVSVQNLPPGISFDPQTILTRMKTRIGDPFSQVIFDEDLKMLAAEYDRVEPIIELRDQDLSILLKVWARPTIRSITWHGNEKFTTKKLQKELKIKPGATFHRQNFNKAFNNVKELYIKKGYFESQLQYTVRLDPKVNEVNVDIQVREGRSGRIDKIVFEGFTKQERSELLQMINTKRYNLFHWLTGDGLYSEEALDEDTLNIITFLQDQGFADAKVQIVVEEAKKKDKIIIKIIADRGPVYHFGRVTFLGNELFTNEQIESIFIVRPGDTYSPEKMRQNAQNIKDVYGRRGYIDTNVQFVTHLVEDEPIYNVDYTIEEGEQYKIGLIHVIGNVQTETRVILHESLLVPGETFDSARLKATQTRLQNIGYFKNVNVYAVRAQEDHLLGDNYRDVYIEVEETSTGSLNVFGGFSTQDDLFGGVELSETNFNFKGFQDILKKGPAALRGGGEYAHIKFTLGQKQRSILFSWLDPYFRDSYWRVGFDVTRTWSEIVSTNYKVITTGGSLFASYPITPFWTFGMKYRARYSETEVNKREVNQNAAKGPDTTTTSGETKKPAQSLSTSGNISAFGLSMNFDSTDSAIKPRNGFRSLIEGEYAGLFGDFEFLRFGYINTLYSQLWRKGVMKYRFDFKVLLPVGKTDNFSDIPVSERFFLGGETSVRGYKPFDIGPHLGPNNPTGGITYSLFSVEYLQNLYGPIDVFVFADAGALSDKRARLGNYRLSYGVGTRLDIGGRLPVILGYGIPVNPGPDEAEKRFFFSLGGQF